MAEKDKVAGKALYTEFRASSGRSTVQIIITPDGLDSNGRIVRSTMYRRQISVHTPRRAWKHYGFGNSPISADGIFETLNGEAVNQFTEQRLNMISPTIDQLSTMKFSLYKTPLVVEVSVEDLDGIRVGSTPYKVLARIQRSRKAAGFEESLIAS